MTLIVALKSMLNTSHTGLSLCDTNVTEPVKSSLKDQKSNFICDKTSLTFSIKLWNLGGLKVLGNSVYFLNSYKSRLFNAISALKLHRSFNGKIHHGIKQRVNEH